MKYLLVVLVVVIGLWLITRGRDSRAPTTTKRRTPSSSSSEMVACAHCGLHLPAPEALRDAQGRPFCEESHRVAGPAR